MAGSDPTVEISLADLEHVLSFAECARTEQARGEDAETSALDRVQAIAALGAHVLEGEVRLVGRLGEGSVLVLDAATVEPDEDFVEGLMGDLRRAAGHDRFTLLISSRPDDAEIFDEGEWVDALRLAREAREKGRPDG